MAYVTPTIARAIARVSAYLPLALTVVLLIITTFNSDVLKFVPLELMLAVSSVSCLLLVVHVESRITSATSEFQSLTKSVRDLEKIQRDYLRALIPPMQTKSLGQSFDLVSTKRKRWNTVRIFAISTQQISTFFNSHELMTERCEILIYQPPSMKPRRDRPPDPYRTDYPVKLWRSLKKEGRINVLTIRSYNFLPMHFECIFDDELLLLGLYEPDPDDPQEIRVGSVTVVENTTPQGEQMIEEYRRRHEGFFETCEKHYGPNPHETGTIADVSS
jgi:hypothetical protein